MPFPVEREFIDRAEARLGVEFPPVFAASMLNPNGGAVEAMNDVWELHPFLDTSDRRRLRTARNEIAQETKEARGRPAFPPGGVAVASNGTSELLVLLPTKEGELGDQIFLWSPDEPAPAPVADDLMVLRPGHAEEEP